MPENMEAHRREGTQVARRGLRARVRWLSVLSARWLLVGGFRFSEQPCRAVS